MDMLFFELQNKKTLYIIDVILDIVDKKFVREFFSF